MIERGDSAGKEQRHFVQSIRSQSGDSASELHGFFAPDHPIHVARAPGRLDVMGGIADYSGSLVLQYPIREATLAAVQVTNSPGLVVASIAQDAGGLLRNFELPGNAWAKLQGDSYRKVQEHFKTDEAIGWAAYVVGPLVVMARELGCPLDGVRVLIQSLVPEAKGVSSSAALEVATMRAAGGACGIELPGAELARLCQVAENQVVGAPCGIMDQMTSALGQAGKLLALLCQPAEVQGQVAVPQEIGFWGIDSGIRHAVSGSDYTAVRTGAFMGYRILADLAGLPTSKPDVDRRVRVEDSRWQGYLANVTRREFSEQFAKSVPKEMGGGEFLQHYGGTTDHMTRVDPQKTYAVYRPTIHPIEEHERVRRFRDLLAQPIDEAALAELGQLMFASHASYSACGLGSVGTDLLVDLVRKAGPARGLFGAKITGGGSGGTVVVLGRSGAGEAVRAIAKQYRQDSGREPYVFDGSSPGACEAEIAVVR